MSVRDHVNAHDYVSDHDCVYLYSSFPLYVRACDQDDGVCGRDVCDLCHVPHRDCGYEGSMGKQVSSNLQQE